MLSISSTASTGTCNRGNSPLCSLLGGRTLARTRPSVTCGRKSRSSGSQPAAPTTSSTSRCNAPNRPSASATPAQMTFGRRRLGKQPLSSIVATNPSCRATTAVNPSRSAATCASSAAPRKRSVKWRFSGRTQLTPCAGHNGRIASLSLPNAAGTRMATKARLTGTASPQAGVQIPPALRRNRRHLSQIVLLSTNHFQVGRHV